MSSFLTASQSSGSNIIVTPFPRKVIAFVSLSFSSTMISFPSYVLFLNVPIISPSPLSGCILSRIVFLFVFLASRSLRLQNILVCSSYYLHIIGSI